MPCKYIASHDASFCCKITLSTKVNHQFNFLIKVDFYFSLNRIKSNTIFKYNFQVSYLHIIIMHFRILHLIIFFSFLLCLSQNVKQCSCKCVKVYFESFQVFGSALLIEGLLFKYDSIFNHHIIKEVLFNNITFEGLSFTEIRQSQCSFMFATGTVLVIFCGSGIFMLKTQSKYLHIIVSTTFLKFNKNCKIAF